MGYVSSANRNFRFLLFVNQQIKLNTVISVTVPNNPTGYKYTSLLNFLILVYLTK